MRYIPNGDKTIHKMLQEMKLSSVENLFSDIIPDHLRLKRQLNLPDALPEVELVRHMKKIASKNLDNSHFLSFLGAGTYNHFIPSAVWNILSRSEFYTAYTPYQPEISQGTLQAIFEFQTLICQLTGMDVANASLYDGASAFAEAVLMVSRCSKKKEILISKAIHPEYRETLYTYCRHLDINMEEIPFTQDGYTDLGWLEKRISSDTGAVAIQNPNFFGTIEELGKASSLIKKSGALFINVITEPVSLGLLKPPGDYGADIVVGEGQGFGNPMNFGGPGVGFFATRSMYVRNMPGRLVGQTSDSNGRTGYVLTLSTREQHIRREKATSNICSNQSLCAVAASIHLSLLGKKGLKELSMLNIKKANYAQVELKKIVGCTLFNRRIFNEFVISFHGEAGKINEVLLKHNIIGGVDLGDYYSDLKNCMLLNITEMHTKTDIDLLVNTIKEIV